MAKQARPTILVVDDEPDVVQSVQDLLRLDYRVLGSTRPQEALPLLEEHEVDVIMTDQRMPGMNGVDFLRRCRERQPDAIRLLFTGYADIKAVIDAINQGSVYRYITKPWDPDELLTIIRQAAEQRALLLERKRLLAELQAKNQALEAANAELKRGNELKEAFIRVASHELRTPLTILLGLADLLVKSPELEGRLKDWLGKLHQAAERLTRLVNQLVKMLQAQHFERPLERRPTEVHALLEEAVEDVRPFVRQRRQELSLDVASDVGSLAVETDKIRDSVDNLLFNAIKFTPDGGKIDVTARRAADGWVEIQVRDSGAGIDPASLPHLFGLFFTSLDVSRHSSGQFEYGRRGLGLGLALVKAFVEMHGGTVGVASQPGRGTTFTIRLPG